MSDEFHEARAGHLAGLSDCELELQAYRRLVAAQQRGHETWVAISRAANFHPIMGGIAGWLLCLGFAPWLPPLAAWAVPTAVLVPLAVLAHRRLGAAKALVQRGRMDFDDPETLAIHAELERRERAGICS